jgi:hypothetical protein
MRRHRLDVLADLGDDTQRPRIRRTEHANRVHQFLDRDVEWLTCRCAIRSSSSCGERSCICRVSGPGTGWEWRDHAATKNLYD